MLSKTKAVHIEVLATLSEAGLERLSLLNKTLRDGMHTWPRRPPWRRFVPTHAICVLLILEQEAAEVGATLTKNDIRRTRDGYGLHCEDMSFDVPGTKDRLGHLRQLLVAVRKE